MLQVLPMALTAVIRFKTTPKLEARAKRVLRLRNAGRANRETISDLGREWFLSRLVEEERQLGLVPLEASLEAKQ